MVKYSSIYIGYDWNRRTVKAARFPRIPSYKMLWTDLKVDVPVGQPAGTAFVQEVDVFNKETEEGNNNLKKIVDSKFI